MDGYPLRCRQSGISIYQAIHDGCHQAPSEFHGENPNCKLILLTDTVYPRIKVTYGGVDAIRPAEEIDAEQFIAQKSFKAKGKRLTTWKIESIEELEPTRFPEPPSEDNDEEPDGSDSENEGENLDPDAGKSEQQVIDELTGQTNLFSERFPKRPEG